ncbi:S-adenosyl-L-methionine-dependent methyltransferase [Cyathus striatus]|nr:S-adenosyl-L-methionine-dependent methyltransferase [Cyathus striatus]
MKLENILSLLVDFKAFVYAGTWPTFKAILWNPTLLFRPTALSRVFMSHVWGMYGSSTDDNSRAVKEGLLTPYASGVVMDIGAGHGHSAHYLDHDKVTKYIAVEPNTLMHDLIRENASKAGFKESDGSLEILPYGAENTSAILSALGGAQVDTIISILTLCTIPSPESTIKAVVHDLLLPGGQLLYYEHVLSHLPDVAWWQRFWAPIWQIPTDGCRIDRPTHIWIEKMGVDESNGVWKEGRMWGKENEPEEHLFWHRAGRYVKR